MGKNNKRGQKMALTAFNGPAEDVTNDRFADEQQQHLHAPTHHQQHQHQHRQQYTSRSGAPSNTHHQQETAHPSRPGDRHLFDVGVNSKLGDFRNEAAAALNTVVPEDLDAPYVAYVGNLQHGISEDQVKWGFLPEEPTAAIVVRNRSTFAFVEFDTRDALQNAVLMSGKIVVGRSIKASVATKQQAERMASALQEKSQSEENATSTAASGESPCATAAAAPQLTREALSAQLRLGGESTGTHNNATSSNSSASLRRQHCSAAPSSSSSASLTRNIFGAKEQPSASSSSASCESRRKPKKQLDDGGVATTATLSSSACSTSSHCSAASPCGASSTAASSSRGLPPSATMRRTMVRTDAPHNCSSNWREEPRVAHVSTTNPAAGDDGSNSSSAVAPLRTLPKKLRSAPKPAATTRATTTGGSTPAAAHRRHHDPEEDHHQQSRSVSRK